MSGASPQPCSMMRPVANNPRAFSRCVVRLTNPASPSTFGAKVPERHGISSVAPPTTARVSVVDCAVGGCELTQMHGLRVRHRARGQRSDPPPSSDSWCPAFRAGVNEATTRGARSFDACAGRGVELAPQMACSALGGVTRVAWSSGSLKQRSKRTALQHVDVQLEFCRRYGMKAWYSSESYQPRTRTRRGP